MKILRKKYFLFKSFVKVELCYVFATNMFSTAQNCKKANNLITIGGFLLLVIIYAPQIILDS